MALMVAGKLLALTFMERNWYPPGSIRRVKGFIGSCNAC